MGNTTTTYWSASGVSLQTLAQNIETLAGRNTPPPLRGDDVTIPYMPGQRWIEKTADSRVLQLAMWVRADGLDGSQVGSASDKFQANWCALRSLLWTPRKQFALTKRFMWGGSLRSATALAEWAGGMEPTMIGPSGAKFVVDLKLADPFFYDDSAQTFSLTDGDQVLAINGDAETANVKVYVNGARNNVIVRRKSPTPDHQVQYAGVLSAGDLAVIDSQAFSSTTTPSGQAAFSSDALMRHAGQPQLLTLVGGNNTINLASTSGAGLVQLVAKGAWI